MVISETKGSRLCGCILSLCEEGIPYLIGVLNVDSPALWKISLKVGG